VGQRTGVSCRGARQLGAEADVPAAAPSEVGCLPRHAAVARPPPPLRSPGEQRTDFGMPSSHCQFMACLLVYCACDLTARYAPSRRSMGSCPLPPPPRRHPRRTPALVALAVLSGCVAVSRCSPSPLHSAASPPPRSPGFTWSTTPWRRWGWAPSWGPSWPGPHPRTANQSTGLSLSVPISRLHISHVTDQSVSIFCVTKQRGLPTLITGRGQSNAWIGSKIHKYCK